MLRRAPQFPLRVKSSRTRSPLLPKCPRSNVGAEEEEASVVSVVAEETREVAAAIIIIKVNVKIRVNKLNRQGPSHTREALKPVRMSHLQPVPATGRKGKMRLTVQIR